MHQDSNIHLKERNAIVAVSLEVPLDFPVI